MYGDFYWIDSVYNEETKSCEADYDGIGVSLTVLLDWIALISFLVLFIRPLKQLDKIVNGKTDENNKADGNNMSKKKINDRFAKLIKRHCVLVWISMVSTFLCMAILFFINETF